MLRRLVASRTVPMLAAVFLVLFCASALRFALPGLRENTRSAAVIQAVRSPADRGKRATRRKMQGVGAGTAGVVKRLVRAFLRFVVWAPPASAPIGLPAGAYAFGTSLPRRLRWNAMGGHGRHGPGAHS